MTRPTRSLIWMGVFVVAVALGCAILGGALAVAFGSNPWFNGVILAILAVGILINARQVISLYPEITWIESWQVGDAGVGIAQPRLLSSMSLMLSGKGDMSLSATSMRVLLDSIRTRLDESRELSRYFISVLVFLGLLGTFWGLMDTVGSVAAVIKSMSVEGAEGIALFENLKRNLEQPLAGMGIAFSSSLFGLAGSLVLGFLDLQAAHAQNRFLNELEEWLSGSTRLSSGVLSDDPSLGGTPAYVQALLEQTADTLEKLQRSSASGDAQRDRMSERLGDLGDALTHFNRAVREQNERLGQLTESHAELLRVQQRMSNDASDAGLDDELRDELRLLSKTIANALAARDP